MNHRKERTWINQCKLVERKFDNGGSVINAAFKVEELKQHVNEGGWVNLVISERRELGKNGSTHSVSQSRSS